MASELAEIKARIIEIRDGLSEPFKGFLNKEINKTEAYFEEDESCIEIKEVFFKGCLKYAEQCRKVEKDFPSRWSRDLATDNVLFNTFRYKLISVCVVDNPPSDIDKIKDKIYTEAREILEKLLSSAFHKSYRYPTLDSIKKSILELLILLLSKKEYVDFSEEYRVFFTDIISLTDKSTINLNGFLDKIDKIEKSKYFFPKNLDNIRVKYFAVIFSIDRSIVYRNLLAKLKGIAKSEFSDHPAVLSFVNCFISKLSKEFLSNPYLGLEPEINLDLAMVLIYRALNRKCEQEITLPPQTNFLNRLNFRKRLVKVPPKPAFGRQLSKFKQDYQDKTAKDFPEEALKSRQFGFNQIHDLPGEIGVYFSMDGINRSSEAIREVLNVALQNYDKLALPEAPRVPINPMGALDKLKERGGAVLKGAEKLAGKIIEKSQVALDDASNKAQIFIEDASNKVQDITDGAIDLMKDTVSDLKLPVSIPKVTINNPFLKNNNSDRSSSIMINNETEIACQNAEERANRETQSEVIKNNIDNAYNDEINKNKLEVEKTIQVNSWFKDKRFSLIEWVQAFFRQGCFYVNLDKLKNRLKGQIDFASEKDFFLKASFFSLLLYGIIRWPWWNKEDFAINWAEQIILLKTKDCIETTTYEALSNKLSFLFVGKADSRVVPEMNSDNKTAFFNTRNNVSNKEPGSSCQSSVDETGKHCESNAKSKSPR
ncbi:hypothetical protein [Rickettsiella endosymbiont of Dermanyssus gallinae]|uniref:hypothetical protein n=1 Tax=Rickettsiella endosymbiont of Dermanyssus gallinae TaxID=2856608 RepID=UPI001C52E7DE|nr:hypothetical protein [Rickettsiella endosymbiont of Dermanyssus gallinae]